MKLAILGNSHAACMLMAHREDSSVLGSAIEPTFFASSRRSMREFRLDERDLVPGSENLRDQIIQSSEGQTRLEVPKFDAFFLVGMRFVFPVLERSYSCAVAQSLLRTMLEDAELWYLVRLLRQVTDRPIFCAHQPLRAESPPPGPFHTYDDIQVILSALTSEMDVKLLPQPPETRVHDLFTRPDLATGSKRLKTGALHPGEDLDHMNSAYGAIYLQHVRRELEVSGVSVARTST